MTSAAPHTLPAAAHLPWTATRPPPGQLLHTWRPTGLDDLARVRRELRRYLSGPGPRTPGSTALDDRIEEVVQALDELTSNAIRHGLPPVVAEVHTTDAGVLVLVSDHAHDTPPRPTSTRDPACGGMGLAIVAHTALASGWTPAGDGKTVWALLPTSQGTAPLAITGPDGGAAPRT